jgi:transcriptional regulator with XRE-family HTH domain
MSMFEGLPLALRILRHRADLTQLQVAERAGMGKSTISSYERGANLPSTEGLEKILAGLGASLLDLHRALYMARGEDPPPVKPMPDEPPLPPVVLDEGMVAGVLAQFFQYQHLVAGLAISRYLGEGKKLR